MHLTNTGIQFTPEQVLQKYKPLRKVRVPLTFSLLYYPYFLTSITGCIKGRIVKKRIVQAQMVVNGVNGSVYRLVNQPDLLEEVNSPQEQPFLIQRPEISAGSAAERTQDAALRGWKRKYETLFAPALQWSVEAHEERCVYKPYWIVSNGQDMTDEMLMIVDATTGLCGVAESMDVKKAWQKLFEETCN